MRYGVQQRIFEDSWMLGYKSKQLLELLMCIPVFIILNTGALSGVLVTGVALAFVHYMIVSVLMQSS